MLAGVIGGLLAQGMPALDAVRTGVYLHGRAGDRLATRFGARGVVASDLPEAIAVEIRHASGAIANPELSIPRPA